MPLIKGDRAPYAPPSAVLDVIDRYRNFSMTTPVDLDAILLAGIAESLAPRTLQAMRLLDLVDDQGNPSPQFNELREVSSVGFPDRLAEHLRYAYREVFAFVDPKTDPIDLIEDAFRSFHPNGQRARMVTLFLGLCERAGIAEEAAPAQSEIEAEPGRPQPGDGRVAAKSRYARQQEGIPPALVGLLRQLPEPGSSWSRKRRDSFLSLFGATLDYVYDLEEESEPASRPIG